jgi:hypothetical protein
MVRVESEFDVKDFCSADTGFFVSLDKLDQHGGDQAGEPADIMIDHRPVQPGGSGRTGRSCRRGVAAASGT